MQSDRMSKRRNGKKKKKKWVSKIEMKMYRDNKPY